MPNGSWMFEDMVGSHLPEEIVCERKRKLVEINYLVGIGLGPRIHIMVARQFEFAASEVELERD